MWFIILSYPFVRYEKNISNIIDVNIPNSSTCLEKRKIAINKVPLLGEKKVKRENYMNHKRHE